ncbi:MAG: hypothetical protein IT357_00035 [Gemmatimonadaceae bacterium]|nr:hypothetical protein [Gemmatimonadaceae bacterium]
MMTLQELDRRVRLYGERMAARQRQLAGLAAPLVVATLAAFFLPRDIALPVLQICVVGAAALAIYIVVSSRTYFASVEINCPACGRSVAAVYGATLEDVKYGEPLPQVLCCPRCGREFASLAT